MGRPKAFIASSVEGVQIAYHIQNNLRYDADCTPWPQGVFELSESPLDSLIRQLETADFAIFVFTPEDEVNMRGNSVRTVRDNVLFELGLFCGRLGKQRCFIVLPDAPSMHLATDLIGVTPATYFADRDPAELAATLGPACHAIRLAMNRLGPLRPDGRHPKIPVSESDEYDDGDKKLLLQDWLRTAPVDFAHKFVLVDDHLKLDRGTTKRLLKAVIAEGGWPELREESTNFFMLGRRT